MSSFVKPSRVNPAAPVEPAVPVEETVEIESWGRVEDGVLIFDFADGYELRLPVQMNLGMLREMRVLERDPNSNDFDALFVLTDKLAISDEDKKYLDLLDIEDAGQVMGEYMAAIKARYGTSAGE